MQRQSLKQEVEPSHVANLVADRLALNVSLIGLTTGQMSELTYTLQIRSLRVVLQVYSYRCRSWKACVFESKQLRHSLREESSPVTSKSGRNGRPEVLWGLILR